MAGRYVSCIFVTIFSFGMASGCSLMDKAASDYEDVTRVRSIASISAQPRSIIIKEGKRLSIDLGGENFKLEYQAATASRCIQRDGTASSGDDVGAEARRDGVSEEDAPSLDSGPDDESSRDRVPDEAISGAVGDDARKNGDREALGDACKNARNRIMSQWMYVSDRACAEHLGGILGRANITNTFLELATITTAGLATFVGGEVTRQALSGSATIAAGAKNAISGEIYMNNLAPLVTRTIETNRSRMGANLIERMNVDTNAYPIDRAIVELAQYHESCSFRVGVQLLADAAERKGPSKPEIDQELQILQKRELEVSDRAKKLSGEAEALIGPDGVRPQDSPTMDYYDKELASVYNELEYIRRRMHVLRSSAPTAAPK